MGRTGAKAQASKGQRFAFPRYARADGTKSDPASATIAKRIRWLKIEHTARDVRHTMADRLREVQVSSRDSTCY
jgi:hypothetical protein